MGRFLITPISKDVYRVCCNHGRSNIELPMFWRHQSLQCYPAFRFTLDMTQASIGVLDNLNYVASAVEYKLASVSLFSKRTVGEICELCRFIDYEQAYEYTSFVRANEDLIIDLGNYLVFVISDIFNSDILKENNIKARDFELVSKVIQLTGEEDIGWLSFEVKTDKTIYCHYIPTDYDEDTFKRVESVELQHVADDFTYENLTEMGYTNAHNKVIHQLQIEG